MRIKILIISLIIIIVSVISTIVSLSLIKVSTELKIDEPDTIRIYKSNLSASEVLIKNSDKYPEIIEKFNNSTKISLMNKILGNENLIDVPEENLDAELWLDINKQTGIHVEFEFNKIQNLVINCNGNSRIIKVKAFIFRLSEKNNLDYVNFYYRSGDSYTQKDIYNENIYPFYIKANTYNLYKLIEN